MDRKMALSIAGFDPSGGAGVLADIQTFQRHKVQGMSVLTALTFQNEDDFLGIEWFSYEQIESQLRPLLRYAFSVVKIGIVQNLETLNNLLLFLKTNFPKAKVIWDPVLKASSGFSFINDIDKKLLHEILNNVHCITPNSQEEMRLCEVLNISALPSLFTSLAVLSKGGHTNEELAIDRLYLDHQVYEFSNPRLSGYDKHGSGCTLSSAIAANYCVTQDWKAACDQATSYMHSFLQSSTSKLGIHFES